MQDEQCNLVCFDSLEVKIMSGSVDKTELPCIDLVTMELAHLRFENERLTDELQCARMYPTLDDSTDRINVSHELWLRQQQELMHLHTYKTRYYALAILLLLLLTKVCLFCR